MKYDLALAYAMHRRSKLGSVPAEKAEADPFADEALSAEPLSDEADVSAELPSEEPSRVASIINKHRKIARSVPNED